jgi:hypothetical protein
MVQIKVVDKIKIHILYLITFSENRAVHDIMSKMWWNQRGCRGKYGGALRAG